MHTGMNEGIEMDNLNCTRKAVEANPQRKHVNAPVHPAIITVTTLDEMIGRHIHCVADNKHCIETCYTGTVVGWYQQDYENETDTWLFVKLAGFARPQPVHWTRFRGFSNMFMGVAK
jgi:hypothetical protein